MSARPSGKGRSQPFAAKSRSRAGHLPGQHVARKRFGQHFLVDVAVIDAIVKAIRPQTNDALVEIGPGLAALTQPFLEHVSGLTVIELDRDLAARLRQNPQLDVVEADVLQVDFTALAARKATQALRVVGNLPYNISTSILFHLMQHEAVIADQHFMLQQEVIERMVAAPATAAYGRLSVMLQWRYEMEQVLFVPPHSFNPPPKVNSAVVRMVPYAHPTAVSPMLLEELVRVAFSQRRKLLRHALEKWLQQKGFVGNFDMQRRAEEVPVAEYIALAHAVSETAP